MPEWHGDDGDPPTVPVWLVVVFVLLFLLLGALSGQFEAGS